jgi:hypothetical protein
MALKSAEEEIKLYSPPAERSSIWQKCVARLRNMAGLPQSARKLEEKHQRKCTERKCLSLRSGL